MITLILVCGTERPLHSMEIVAEVLKKWSTWPDEFLHGVRLCAKQNYVYINITGIVSSASVCKHHCSSASGLAR